MVLVYINDFQKHQMALSISTQTWKGWIDLVLGTSLSLTSESGACGSVTGSVAAHWKLSKICRRVGGWRGGVYLSDFERPTDALFTFRNNWCIRPRRPFLRTDSVGAWRTLLQLELSGHNISNAYGWVHRFLWNHLIFNKNVYSVSVVWRCLYLVFP